MSILNTKFSGRQFNKRYQGTKFYKFIFDDLSDNKFHYHLGINSAIEPDGLSFCEESKRGFNWWPYGTKVALIEIPDDAEVYAEKNKFRANKIILTQILNSDDFGDKFWIEMLSQNGMVLKFVKNQTEEICTIAVKQNSFALSYVKQQTEKLCKIAVKNDTTGDVLNYVEDRFKTKELCTLAVKQNGYALRFVYKSPLLSLSTMYELTELALQQNGYDIKYIGNQTTLICKLAIKQNPYSLFFVARQYQTDEICKFAVQQNGLALQYVINQTDEICELAVQQNGNALQFVKKQTPKICELAVEQTENALMYVEYPLRMSLNFAEENYRRFRFQSTNNE